MILGCVEQQSAACTRSHAPQLWVTGARTECGAWPGRTLALWLSDPPRISAQILPNFCNAPSVGGWRIQPAQVSFSLALSSPPIGPVPADQPIRGRGRRWWIFPNLEVCTDPAKPGLMLASSSVLGIAETSLGFCLGLAHPVALVPACGKQSQT